ncbi:MAG: molybdopterin-synthase adenylyltransferase MoeB [Cytophagales bacterium]|nr:molybdopterin-synthase adenylyltransferase MoeB [Cytophagales bacterium]
MLSPKELNRYSRHIILPEIGQKGQEKLKQAKVLVVGAGGLGCPVLQYLTAAGVGTIGIVDFDKVDESNLQRQILYDVEDIGKQKAETARHKLSLMNPYINFEVYDTRLDKDNALDIFKDYEIIVDGSDNFPTRYLVNDACVILDKPLVYGSISRFEGQVSVFNFIASEAKQSPSVDMGFRGAGPTYRCLFPKPPNPEDVPNCAEAGVLGVLPGIIGTMQANEVIKIITGIGEPLSGKLFIFDALSFENRTINFKRVEENCEITGLIDYEQFCNSNTPLIKGTSNNNIMKEITVLELKEKLDKNEDITIIDVREQFEYDICNLQGVLIPMGELMNNTDKIPKDKPVVVHCRTGSRSAQAVQFLSQKYDFDNLYNLKGGIHAWATEIDTDMATY